MYYNAVCTHDQIYLSETRSIPCLNTDIFLFFLFREVEFCLYLRENNIMKLVRKQDRLHVAGFILLVSGIMIVLYYNSLHLGYKWQWYRIPGYLFSRSPSGRIIPGKLLKGLGMTLRISVVSLLFTVVIGFVTAFLRLSSSVVGRFLARVYLELIRNTPLLIQILFTYFVIAPLLGLSPFVSAVISLSLFEGAYTSEIIRGGIVSVSRGQWESAYSLGLSPFDTYRFIIIPQTLSQILPPLASQSVSLIKDSALVSTIAIYDLTMAGQEIISGTFLTFEVWFTVALIYLMVTIPVSFLIRVLEKRMSYEK